MKANNGILLQEIKDYIRGECLKHSSEGLRAYFPTGADSRKARLDEALKVYLVH